LARTGAAAILGTVLSIQTNREKNKMVTYQELEQMSEEQRADFFRSLPIATLLRLAGDAADPLLDQAQAIPGLNLTGLEDRLAAHNTAKAETAELMGRLAGK
jgi:hypothetical protein